MKISSFVHLCFTMSIITMSIITMLVSVILNCLLLSDRISVGELNNVFSSLSFLQPACVITVLISFFVTIILSIIFGINWLIYKTMILLKFSKSPGDYWYIEGDKCYQSGDYENAKKCFIKAVKLKSPKGIDGLEVLRNNRCFNQE